MDIEKYLISLNFDTLQNRGFQYWKEAVNYCKNKTLFKMEDVYNHIAKKYNATRYGVEAVMRRYMLDLNSEEIFKYISPQKRITNKIVLISIMKHYRLQKNKMNIDFKGKLEDISMLLVSAERYALGRQTYIVQWTCEVIKKNLHLLSNKDKQVMIRDLENPISYGNDCDKTEWLKLLNKLKEKEC